MSHDHSGSTNRRPLCTHTWSSPDIAHINTSNTLPHIVSSSYPVVNSVLASVTPLCSAQDTIDWLQHPPPSPFSSRVQKCNILFLKYVKNAWPRSLLLSVRSMLVCDISQCCGGSPQTLCATFHCQCDTSRCWGSPYLCVFTGLQKSSENASGTYMGLTSALKIIK